MNTGSQEKAPSLKERLELEVEDNPDLQPLELKSAAMLPDDTQFNECDSTELVKVVADDKTEIDHKAKSSGRLWLLGLLAVVGLSIFELIFFTQQLLEQQDLLGGLWLVVLGLFLTLAVVELVKQWLGLKRLKQQEADKSKAEQIYNSPAIGMGESFCLHLAKGLPDVRKMDVAIWKDSLTPHHNDKEILALFEQQVLVPADNAAIKKITQHAGAAGAMIAVSPFALLDMAIVLWRNFKMMNQISQDYGVNLSYWGRVSLVRNVFKTMLYAGASEIIADAGNYAMGAGLAGKLSTRLAQGMSAGVLTARIGIKTMQACRPVPWLSTQKPGISGISTQLLEDLKKLVS